MFKQTHEHVRGLPMMMCWHKWDIKQTREHPIFDSLCSLGRRMGPIPFLVTGAISALTLFILYQNDIRFDVKSFNNKMDYNAAYMAVWALITGIYFVISLLCFYGLKWATTARDKICLKCHLTLFDASKFEEKLEEKLDAIKQDKERKKATQRNIKRAAHKVFETRRAMRKKAQT